MTCAPFPPTHVPKPWGIALGYEGPGRRQMHARQYASEKKKPRTTGHGEAECKCRFRLWRCVAVVGKGKNAAEREERATEWRGHSTARYVSAVMKPQKIPIRMKLKLMVLTAGQSLQSHAVQPCTVKTQKNGFNKIQGTSKLLMQTNASLCAGAHHRGRW